MPDIILHHYPTSPFSEKIRAILGYKNLAWKSVHTPVIMPKPDLTALTGGYRRAPVLQIGADIYCDSKLIVNVLERLFPNPPLLSAAVEASCAVWERWTEQVLFFLTIPIVFQPAALPHFFGKQPAAAAVEFQKDREGFMSSGTARRPSMAVTQSELPPFLAQLDRQLSAAPFLLGPAPAVADFSVYHLVWFIHSNPGVAAYLHPYKSLLAWVQRMAAYGHGKPEEISGEDAIQLARSSHPAPSDPTVQDPSTSFRPGDAVTVNATDYGTDPVSGEWVQWSRDEISIRRTDPRAGEVVVHFPRAGFRLAAPRSPTSSGPGSVHSA